jgi:Spy/CpxP family protein refolding chaperone
MIMKKTLALLMALALVISAIALPALAENNTVDQTTSATMQTARGGRGGKGQMPGQNNRNRQMPQMPNQNGQNGQQQIPDQNNQQQLPGKIGRKGFRGENTAARTEKLEQWLTQLVTDGVITQEVSDAILTHVKEQLTQAQTGTAAPAESAEAPAEAAPEGNPEEQLLKEMLDSGVITQEQYDQYAARFSMPEAPEAGAAGT